MANPGNVWLWRAFAGLFSSLWRLCYCSIVNFSSRLFPTCTCSHFGKPTNSLLSVTSWALLNLQSSTSSSSSVICCVVHVLILVSQLFSTWRSIDPLLDDLNRCVKDVLLLVTGELLVHRLFCYLDIRSRWDKDVKYDYVKIFYYYEVGQK